MAGADGFLGSDGFVESSGFPLAQGSLFPDRPLGHDPDFYWGRSHEPARRILAKTPPVREGLAGRKESKKIHRLGQLFVELAV